MAWRGDGGGGGGGDREGWGWGIGRGGGGGMGVGVAWRGEGGGCDGGGDKKGVEVGREGGAEDWGPRGAGEELEEVGLEEAGRLVQRLPSPVSSRASPTTQRGSSSPRGGAPARRMARPRLAARQGFGSRFRRCCGRRRLRDAAEPSGSGGVATTHAHALLAAIAAAAGQRGTACTQQGSGDGGNIRAAARPRCVDERTKGWLGKYVWVLRELG